MKPDELTTEKLDQLVRDEAMLPAGPWELWNSCSFRRITGPDGKEGGVLHAYNQRSDNHPDLSMPEDQLFALVRLRNALPALLNAARKEPPAGQGCDQCHKYVGKCPYCHSPRPTIAEWKAENGLQPPAGQGGEMRDVFERPFDGDDDPRLRVARALTRAEAEAVLEHRGDLIAALTAGQGGGEAVTDLTWIAAFAELRSKDDSKTFARVNRAALRTIAARARQALAAPPRLVGEEKQGVERLYGECADAGTHIPRSPLDWSPLDLAIRIATAAHSGQTDRGNAPYILHPLRVMLAQQSVDARIVAVLHDVLEDCPWIGLDSLREQGFSEQVLSALVALTRVPDETYDQLIDRVFENPLAVSVKVADLNDNMDVSRLTTVTDNDRRRLLKYERAKARLLTRPADHGASVAAAKRGAQAILATDQTLLPQHQHSDGEGS